MTPMLTLAGGPSNRRSPSVPGSAPGGTWPDEPVGFVERAYWIDSATLTGGNVSPDGTPYRTIIPSGMSSATIITTTNTIVASAGNWISAGITNPATDPDNTPMYVRISGQDAGNEGVYALVTAVSALTITVEGTPLTANAVPDASWTLYTGWGEKNVVTTGATGSPTIGGPRYYETFLPGGVDGGHDAGRMQYGFDSGTRECFIGSMLQFPSDSPISTSEGGNKQHFVTFANGSRYFTNLNTSAGVHRWSLYKGSLLVATSASTYTFGGWTRTQLYVNADTGAVQLTVGSTLELDYTDPSPQNSDMVLAYDDGSNNGNHYPGASDPRKIGEDEGGPVDAYRWTSALYVSTP